ncbi:hypothetical protein BJV77DRAFT_1000217 [Russula vinacea]|nr:hypothetical protein BJV77DRAFT_1000217 [Russula vinacea]
MDNSTFGEPFRASRSWVNLPTTCKAAAGMTGGNRNRPWRGSPRPQSKKKDEVLIRELEQREKSLDAVLISAGAISASVVYRILYNIINFHSLQKPFLFSAVLLYFSQETTSPTAAPQAPVPSVPPSLFYQTSAFDMLPFRILRLNMYWITSFVFSVTAIVLAMLGKHLLREHRDRLVHRLPQTDVDKVIGRFSGGSVRDTMYRLFQVALILVLLGHIDAIVISAGLDVLIPTVVGGLLYTFGFIAPADLRPM